MEKKILEKLKGYGLSAGAMVLGTGAANAQINYTDINPDVTVSGNGSYALDLNNDSNIDFNVYASSSASSFSSFYFASAQVFVSASGNNAILNDTSYYAYALNSGNNINNNAGNWLSYGNLAGSFAFVSSTFSFSSAYGNWLGQTDKYLGLRLTISGQNYYGWARLDVSGSANQFTIKDYAIQANPGITIQAGDTFALPPAAADTAMNVVGADVANNGNGLDLEVSFDKAQDETTISQYRILVVKEANAGAFNLSAAQAVGSNNYTVVSPTGSNISTVLANNARDVNGDFITENQPYRVFILSKADGVNAQADALSSQSNSVTLFTPIIPSDPAMNLIAADVDNNGNGSDIEVTFDAANDESKVMLYTLIAVKTANAASFTVNDAQAVPPSGKKVVNPSGSTSYTALLTASQNDSDGDPIASGVPYKIIIQSVADGQNAIVDTISAPSNEVTLQDIGAAPSAQNVMLADIDNNANGSDVEVSFTKADDETGITEYRIFIIKEADAASFNLANAASNSNYGVETPTGANITTVLDASSTDIDGDLIQPWEPYKAKIMSVSDGVNTNASSLSNASNTITLDDPLSVNELDENPVQVYFDGASIQIKSENPIGDVLVTDLNGKTVHQTSSTQSQASIATSQMAKGLYFVRMNSTNTTEIRKVVIH